MSADTLRALGLGEIVDRAASVWRVHWRPLFQLALPFQLAQYVAVKGGVVLGQRLFPDLQDPSQLARLQESTLAQVVGLVSVLVAVLTLTLYLSQLGGVALTHYLVPRLSGTGAPDPGSSGLEVLRRLGPATVAFTVGLALAVAVAALWLVPGLAAIGAGLWALEHRSRVEALTLLGGGGLVTGLTVVGLLLWFILRFMLVAQVAGAEAGSGLAVLRRAGELASGRVGAGLAGLVKVRLAVLLTVIGAILLLVSVVASAPSLALGVAFGASFRPGHSLEDVVPQGLLVPVQVAQVAVGALFAPIYEAFKVVFYLDVRVRREGLDLELTLR